MKSYIYPANLKVKATLWFWSLRDLIILIVGAVISVLVLLGLRSTIILAITVAFGIATAQIDDHSIMGYIITAVRYLFIVPQTYYRKFDTNGDPKHEKET